MIVGVLGPGRIGGTLARHWARAGHDVRVSLARDPARLAEAAREQVAARLRGARVVRAFNMLPADELAGAAGGPDAGRLTVFVCGDDADAKRVAERLVDDAGPAPVDTGPLRHAPWQGPFGPLFNRLVAPADAPDLVRELGAPAGGGVGRATGRTTP